MTDVNIETDVPNVIPAPEGVEGVDNTETTENKEAADGGEDENEGEPNAEELARKRKTALRNRERQLSKARAENAQLREKIAEFERQQAARLASVKAPDENSFETYSDLVEARAVHKAEQKILEVQETAQKQQLQQQQEAALQRRDAEIAQTASQFAEVVADYRQTLVSADPILSTLPDRVNDMLRELDNPAAAVYVLTKEGRLQDLAYMNPHFAAVALMQAQERGEGFANTQRQQRVSPQPNTPTAPEPMRGARGTATSSSKSLSQMSAKELAAWVNSGD
jgi:chromosome segregation ATPase